MSRLHKMDDRSYAFHCPGCECGHMIPVVGNHPVWSWNNSLDFPTFSPSIRVSSGHYAAGHTSDQCWCTYNASHSDDPSGFKCELCHSFVTEGTIQFLLDSTHKLSGQTVDIPDWDLA